MTDTQVPTITAPAVVELAEKPSATAIIQYRSELNLNDTTSIVSWGTQAQKKVATINGQMLDGVRAKDTGEVGESLTSMVTSMRGLDFSKATDGKEPGFFGRLLGKVTPIAEFIGSFEEVSSQVNAVANRLESHIVGLMKSVKNLDNLYGTTLEYYHDLGNYIAAGKEILNELDTVTIPKMKEDAANGDMVLAQNLNDLVAKRDTFERRVHDIELTRQVVMQSLPQIRMVQNNDTDLITKINTQIINTIPLWEGQLVIAVETMKMRSATKDTKAVADFQNDLLVKNAEMLKVGNAEARREIERGVYDIEAIKKANDTLVATIEESIAIAAEGKTKRLQAATELAECENQLKQALRSAA